MYTNLLLVFGVRTANLPTTTRVPFCHTKVRGPRSRTNGAVVWPVKHNVQALTRASLDSHWKSHRSKCYNIHAQLHGSFFWTYLYFQRNPSIYLNYRSSVVWLSCNVLHVRCSTVSSASSRTSMWNACPNIKRGLFGLSAYLIENHRKQGVPHALPPSHTHTHTRARNCTRTGRYAMYITLKDVQYSTVPKTVRSEYLNGEALTVPPTTQLYQYSQI